MVRHVKVEKPEADGTPQSTSYEIPDGLDAHCSADANKENPPPHNPVLVRAALKSEKVVIHCSLMICCFAAENEERRDSFQHDY